MNVTLGSLKPGQWRDLTTAEMADINSAVANSTKTANGEPDLQFDDVEEPEFNDVEENKSPIDTSKLDFNRGKSNKSATTAKPTAKSKTKLSLNKKQFKSHSIEFTTHWAKFGKLQ